VKRYLRPLGLLSGSAARDAIAAGLALPLGGGPLAYSLVEVIKRHGPGDIRRSIVTFAREAGEGGAHRLRWEGEGAFESLKPPRPPTADAAGPSLSRSTGEGLIVMGVVNATPDSFSDGGDHFDPAAAIAHAEAMIRAGAGIVDIGGESTRPGSEPVPVEEEIRRVVPVIAGIRAMAEAVGITISIDTRNAVTMLAALDAGASMINDVSALTHDPDALAVAAQATGPVVLMHMQGEPRTMQLAPTYDDVALDVYDALEARIAAAEAAGVDRSRIVADPGIGFGKTVEHNLALLGQFSLFHGLGVPLLVGVSRKGFLARLSAGEPPGQRLGGSLAAGLAATQQGARIVRVHDVPETLQALRVIAAIRNV
jgi:dihydropteroate synthase